ncbi:MAG: polysaccharide biosynthesis C-terminal domain-containing protein [Bacteroidota bacterium]
MLKKIIHTFFSKILVALCNLLVAVVISQYLHASGKGVQGIIITDIAMLLIFTNIVCGAVLVYLTPRYKTFQLLVPAYIWSIFIGLCAFVLFSVTSFFHNDYTFHIVLLTVLNSFFTVNNTILVGKEEIKSANLVNSIQSSSLIAFLLLFYMGFGWCNIQFYLYALYISYFISIIISSFKLKKHIKFQWLKLSEMKPVFKDSFKYGLINQASHILQLLNFRISYYFLDYFSGKSSVGIYSNAIQISESIWIVSSSICMVQYARISNSNDLKQSQMLTAQLVQIGLAVTFVLCVILLFLPAQLFMIIFGPDFGEVSTVIKSLIPGIFIYNFALIIGHYFSGIGRYKTNTCASLIGLVATALAAPIMINKYSYIGAGLASSISYAFTSAFVIYVFVRESKISILNLLPKYSVLKQQVLQIKNNFINE